MFEALLCHFFWGQVPVSLCLSTSFLFYPKGVDTHQGIGEKKGEDTHALSSFNGFGYRQMG